MSIKNKFFSILTLAFAVFGFATFAAAQETPKTDADTTQKQENREWRKGKRDKDGDGFRGGERRGGGMMRGFRELNLTETQKTQIKTIMDANRPDQSLMEEMRTLHQAKRDGTLTAEQQTRFQTLKQQAREKGESIHKQVMAILTPEQLQQLEQKKAEMQKNREERKQMRQQNKQTPETEKKDN